MGTPKNRHPILELPLLQNLTRLSTNRPEPGGGFRRAGWRQWTGDGDQTRHEAIKSRLLPKFSFPINRPERVDWLISGNAIYRALHYPARFRLAMAGGLAFSAWLTMTAFLA